MKQSHYDVMVIGGGPAGSITGYHLAKAGLRVVVIDAKTFPRGKPCGGGLQARAIPYVPFDLGDVLRGAMSQMSLSFALGEPCARRCSEPLVYGVLRAEFDHHLLLGAESVGATIRQGVRVRNFSVEKQCPLVAHTDDGDFTADVLVGADGANSVVSSLLNKREDYFWQAAVYCEVPEEFLNANAVAGDCMRIDWGSLPSGYAWAFPKRGYVNVGAGGPVAVAKLLRPYLTSFLRATEMLKADVQLKFSGHQLPTLTRRTRFSNERILLVGDAAGLVEPFTGDGISFACQSAKIAASSIYDALMSGEPDVSGYERRIKSEVASEILLSRKLLSLSVAFPDIVYRLFRHNDRIWHTFCAILRGDESFRRLKNEILGPLQFVSRAVDLVTRRREHKALGVRSLTSTLRQFSV